MSILDLFGRSPFKPLQEHMRVVLECEQEVRPLFEALCSGNTEEVRRRNRRIDELEGQADQLKNDLRAHLPKRLLLPVDRRDLLEVLDLQDSIADTAQDIGGLLTQRSMPVPETMEERLLDLVGAVERACQGAGGVIDSLDELVEIGFRGREAERVARMIGEVGSLEGETDRLGAELSRELFRLEEMLPPVTVMFWYQLLSWIGDLADQAEKVCNRVRLLIAR